mmetsp:Transcript_35060/g.73622  ORF Transcript_35060/g.73622 Transcript_35060/m.73622 type:complete len:266 (+) Transcript_35060:638-1435(+)
MSHKETFSPYFFNNIEPHRVFCRLIERRNKILNITMHPKHFWGVDLPGPCIDGITCSKTEESSTIALQFIYQFWQTYRSSPKLAFLNAMAGHDYSTNWETMIPKAEAYDEHVHSFLKAALSRGVFEHTVIIIRSDHGLQKGQMAIDYSLQVEHRRPWTEILVPEDLVVSKSSLFNNQDRMLTGFDLYHTMRFLMSNRRGSRELLEGGIPEWSFNILAEEIPQNRSCEEAKVDPDLCRKVKQNRNYGICNYLDQAQAPFCTVNRTS